MSSCWPLPRGSRGAGITGRTVGLTRGGRPRSLRYRKHRTMGGVEHEEDSRPSGREVDMWRGGEDDELAEVHRGCHSSGAEC